MISECQVFSFTVPGKPKSWTKLESLTGGTFRVFAKKSHSAKKTEREDPLGLFNDNFVAKYRKK